MWTMIESLSPIVAVLAPTFTQAAFAVNCELLLCWVMCLGQHRLQRVAENAHPASVPDHSQRHGLDKYYNFFERSAWTRLGLAYRVAVLIVTHMPLRMRITLLVDDTLAHKRGRSVWGLGWWRDAVASTQKRVATASGHNWVVLAVAVCVPFTNAPILALPLLARLHLPGKGQPSCVDLARAMLADVLGWFPEQCFTLVGDGAYASEGLLHDLDPRVIFVGRLRGDAALYDPQVPVAKRKRPGRKGYKGPRLPRPKEAAAKADRKRTSVGAWVWQALVVTLYGAPHALQALAYRALWPRVLGKRPIQVIVVRDPSGTMRDAYLFTTDLDAGMDWVITLFAWRWAIEVLFRASKQVLELEAPQHWCPQSVEKLAPWVWSMQSVIMVWYYVAGRHTPEAKELHALQGPWDSEWSLRHMLQVLRLCILNVTINPDSADRAQLQEMVQTLKNWANLAA
jgi:DDE superfamily endonuclease